MQGSLRGDQIRDITHWNATRREASASMLKGTENLGEIEGMGNAPVVFHKLERDYQVHYFIYKVTLVLIVCLEGIKLPGRLGHLPDNDDEAQPLSPTTINRGRTRALAFRTLRDQKFRVMTRNFVCEIFNGSDGIRTHQSTLPHCLILELVHKTFYAGSMRKTPQLQHPSIEMSVTPKSINDTNKASQQPNWHEYMD